MHRPAFSARHDAVDGFNIQAFTCPGVQRLGSATGNSFLNGRCRGASVLEFLVRRAGYDLFLCIDDCPGPPGGQSGLPQDRADLIG